MSPMVSIVQIQFPEPVAYEGELYSDEMWSIPASLSASHLPGFPQFLNVYTRKSRYPVTKN